MIFALLNNLAPIAAVALAALISVPIYLWQKYVDRKNELKKMRMEDYKRILEAYIDTVPGVTSPGYLKAMLNLFVVSSDDVLRRVGDVHELMRKDGGDESDPEVLVNIKVSFVSMIRTMREDCFESTRLSDEEIGKLLPFK